MMTRKPAKTDQNVASLPKKLRRKLRIDARTKQETRRNQAIGFYIRLNSASEGEYTPEERQRTIAWIRDVDPKLLSREDREGVAPGKHRVPRSERHKRKLRRAAKARWKGTPRDERVVSDEARERMRVSAIARWEKVPPSKRKFTEENKRAVSEGKTGRKRGPMSEEHKRAIGEAQKLRWFYRKHPEVSPEAIEKMNSELDKPPKLVSIRRARKSVEEAQEKRRG